MIISEAGRTAALCGPSQHPTQVQIRFFITTLQQMARDDPVIALLSLLSGVPRRARWRYVSQVQPAHPPLRPHR